MTRSDLDLKMTSKQLMTVRGAVENGAQSVAWVLPHERTFHSIYGKLAVDLPAAVAPVSAATQLHHGMSDILPEQLHELRVDPTAFSGANLVMEREDEVFREVEALTKAVSGKGVLVDVTSRREGRDLAKLRRLAERLDLLVVASTSFEEGDDALWPTTLSAQERRERMAKVMETELMFGVGETQSEGCTGLIYQQVHLLQASRSDFEDALVDALAIAQANTTAPVYLSFSHDQRAAWASQQALQQRILEWIDALVAKGAAADRVVICHADLWSETSERRAFLLELFRRGVMLSFDMIGHDTVSETVMTNPIYAPIDSTREPPRTSVIAQCVASFIQEHGLLHQILVSSGVQQRIQFQRYGGGGFSYVLHHFKNRLVRQHGVSEAQWQQLTSQNPLCLLVWYSPPEAAPIPKHFIKCSICANYFEPIVGEYFTKFQFTYCGTKCLRKHSKMGFKPLE